MDMAVKKAAKKAPAKKAPAKKAPARGKNKAGDGYVCGVCGLAVTVDEVCGCVDTCDIICCDTPMKKKRTKK
jgi:hypothetical protein